MYLDLFSNWLLATLFLFLQKKKRNNKQDILHIRTTDFNYKSEIS